MSGTPQRRVILDTQEMAVDLLRAILRDEVDPDMIDVDFSTAKWARFTLKLSGDHYKSSLDSGIMSALIEYQTTLYRLAAFVKNDKLNGNAISDQIKERLALNFVVSNGSSEIESDAWKALVQMAESVTKGMGNGARLTIVLFIALTLFGAYAVPKVMDTFADIKKEEISKDKEIKNKEIDSGTDLRRERARDQSEARAQEALEKMHEADMAVVRTVVQSQAETISLLSHAAHRHPKIGEMKKHVDAAVSEVLRQSGRADHVELQGISFSGETARLLTANKRQVSSEVKLTGIFIVEAADSTSNTVFSCRVLRVHDHLVVNAEMYDALMSDKDQKVIQGAFWSRKRVALTINARKLRGSYKDAQIVSAELVEE